MGGDNKQLQSEVFSYMSLEERVPQDHPLRPIRRLVDQVLTRIQRNSIDCTPRSVARPLIKESLDFRRMIREATSQKRQYLGRKECYGESYIMLCDLLSTCMCQGKSE